MFMLNMENQKTKCEKLRVKLLMIILNKNCMKMTFGPMDQKSFFIGELVVNLTTSGI